MAESIKNLLDQAKRLASAYKVLTGKPLGITGEIGEFEAATHLDLELAGAREAGVDARARHSLSFGDGLKLQEGSRIEIKTRSLSDQALKKSQALSKLNLDGTWEFLCLVLLDENCETRSIHLAGRVEVLAKLKETKKGRELGVLTVSEVRRIGHQVWPQAAEN